MDVPTDETPILNKLLRIRGELEKLKSDRSKFLRSEDVVPYYDMLITLINRVTRLRLDNQHKGEHNRLDVVFDDCFSLLSLFYLGVGRINEAPATYAGIITIKRLLDHLTESGVVADKDLSSIDQQLRDKRRILDISQETCDPSLITFLSTKLDACEEVLHKLQASLSNLSPELIPTLDKLVSIRRQLAAIGSKPKYVPQDLKPLIEELRSIEASRVDGHFLSATGDIPEGQAILTNVIEHCHNLAEELTANRHEVDDGLRPIYETLLDIRSQLERLNVTHRWTLRETDLHTFQTQLQGIDDKRVNGKFCDEQGNVPEGQWVLLYLLRKSYAMIYGLLLSSEAVSEGLMPVHNQLSTVKRCLLAVKKNGGLSSARELYPYQMKLASIESLRVDGKFMVGNAIPEGQGLVNALLSEVSSTHGVILTPSALICVMSYDVKWMRMSASE